MQINQKNTQLDLLSSSYEARKQSINSNNGGFDSNFTNALTDLNSANSVNGVNGVDNFNIPQTQSSEIRDSFSISRELANVQNFAKNFIGDLSTLGGAMANNGILNAEEKMGFDILSKINPTLDSTKTQELLQNGNLSKDSANLLDSVDKKISMVRYFGGF